MVLLSGYFTPENDYKSFHCSHCRIVVLILHFLFYSLKTIAFLLIDKCHGFNRRL